MRKNTFMKNHIRIALAGVFTALLATTTQVVANEDNQLGYQPITEKSPLKTKGHVYRVLDGDTFIINVSNEKDFQRIYDNAEDDEDKLRYLKERHNSIRVRLANADTPESIHEDKSKNTKAGELASAHVQNMIEGSDVTLMCYDFGDYGRIICNVGFEVTYKDERNNEAKKTLDLTGYLIKNGMSPYVTYFGKSPFYHETYKKLEEHYQ